MQRAVLGDPKGVYGAGAGVEGLAQAKEAQVGLADVADVEEGLVRREAEGPARLECEDSAVAAGLQLLLSWRGCQKVGYVM